MYFVKLFSSMLILALFVEAISIGMIHVEIDRGELLYIPGALPNALSVMVGDSIALCIWGEAAVSNPSLGKAIVIAPTYRGELEGSNFGRRAILTSRYIASYGGTYRGGMSYLEWFSRTLTLNDTVFTLRWSGSSNIVDSTSSSVLITMAARIDVNVSRGRVESVKKMLTLAPLATVVDPEEIEVYGIGLLYPQTETRVFNESEVVGLAKRTPLIFALLTVYVEKLNVSIVVSGAMVGLSEISGKSYLKIYLGIARAFNASNTGFTVSSYSLAIATFRNLDRILEIAIESVKRSQNPLQALQLLWRELALQYHRTYTSTTTVTRTLTIEVPSHIDAVEAAAITAVSMIVGIFVGLWIASKLGRLRTF